MSDDGFLVELTLIGVLILVNGFFAGAEIAVLSARPARFRPLAESGDRRAVALLRLKENPDRFLATVQIGVTVVGTLASAVGGVAAVERLEPLLAAIPFAWMRGLAEPLAVVTVVVVISYASLVIGELVPKSLAVRHADTLALAVARPIAWLGNATSAVVAVLTKSTAVVLRLMGQTGPSTSPFHTLDDLRGIVREAEEQGVVEGTIMRGALSIQDRELRALMTPRSKVVAIPRNATLVEALRIARESGYSRLPVHAADRDEFVGIVLTRDLYEAAITDPAASTEALIRTTLVVPERKSGASLLSQMRKAQKHMALVVDEHGGFVGVVTLEDLIEVILGDIEDESDVPNRKVRTLAPGVLQIDGSIAVRELNEKHDLALPESGEYVTLAGLILARHGAIPKGGEQVDVPPYRLTVLKVADRRVESIRLERIDQSAADAVHA